MTVEPNERLTVVLEAQAWNVVLTVLAEAPFKLAAPLIQDIQRQCMQQEHVPVPVRRNGEARETQS